MGEHTERHEGIDADAKNLSIEPLELSIVVAEGDELVATAAGEGEDIEDEDDVLLAAEAKRMMMKRIRAGIYTGMRLLLSS